MSNQVLTNMLYALGFLSLFLLLGTFLRARIKAFQSTFMPASVIGGFLLLLLGPSVLNWLHLPKDWLSFYALLPGILIVPVIASIPLGLSLKANQGALKNVFPLALIASAIGMLQFALGFATHLTFSPNFDFYPTFGMELSLGFVGGHGTAGVIANMLQGMNQPYWQTAQGVVITTATFGLLGGTIMGMILINWGVRKGYTALLQEPAKIPKALQTGIYTDPAEQPIMGHETTASSSIDSYAFISAIVLAGCAISYAILNLAKTNAIPIVKDVSIWAICLVVMFILWGLLCRFKLDYLIDKKAKSKISGSLTEFAVIAAIASFPIKAVLAYVTPITVMIVLGFILTALFLIYMCKYCLNSYWFEQMLTIFGLSTGVFVTGVLLLRICDPDFKSPVLANYSLAFTMTSIFYFAILAFLVQSVINNGPAMGLAITLALGLGQAVLAYILSKVLKA